MGVLGYIGILYHKEHPPEVWHFPPGTLCVIFLGSQVRERWETEIKTHLIKIKINNTLHKHRENT
jgi:hypothetical protein